MKELKGVYGSLDFSAEKTSSYLRAAKSQNDIRELDDVCNIPMKIEELNFKI
mgnify:CR=1 FL=1